MPVAEEMSVIALLSDISSSLAAIKNQQTGLQDALIRAGCHCDRCHQHSLATHKPMCHRSVCGSPTRRATAQGFPSSVTYEEFSISHDDPHVVATENLVDLIAVPYDGSTPMDQHLLAALDSRYEDVLEKMDIQNSLSCLPPDDHRLALPATRGAFLKQFMSDINPLSSPMTKEILQGLDYFREFRTILGSGHFWIRDYDSQGYYTQWDCVDLPNVISNRKARDKSSKCKIPDSIWPLDWSIQQKTTPIAPWRRIM